MHLPYCKINSKLLRFSWLSRVLQRKSNPDYYHSLTMRFLLFRLLNLTCVSKITGTLALLATITISTHDSSPSDEETSKFNQWQLLDWVIFGVKWSACFSSVNLQLHAADLTKFYWPVLQQYLCNLNLKKEIQVE